MDPWTRWLHGSRSNSFSTMFAILLCGIALCLVESKTAVRECYCSSCASSVAKGPATPPTCTTNGSCYSRMEVLPSGAVALHQGCLPLGASKKLCHLSAESSSLSCCYGNLCNTLPLKSGSRKLLTAGNIQTSSAPDNYDASGTITLAVGVGAVLVLAVLIVATVVTTLTCYVCYHTSVSQGSHCLHPTDDVEAAGVGVEGKRCSAIVPYHETLSSMLAHLSPESPSLSLLVQEAIVSRVVLESTLTRDTYSTYHEGRWRDETVGVRVYPELHEQMFYSESNLYQTPHMRHDNIVTFIAAQSRQRSDSSNISYKYLITLHYGGVILSDYLRSSTLNVQSALLLARSAAAGLAHLHREVLGENGRVQKDEIAHRNISSRAFWVKPDGECCLGDLSLAIKNNSDFRSHLRCKPLGHTHYLSPELLSSNDVNQDGIMFEDLKRSDVYAFSLVMWEIARRCVIHGKVETAEWPYAHVGCGEVCQEVCPQMATHVQMKEAVLTRRQRPLLAEQWSLDGAMRSYVSLFVESWSDDPEKRLTAMSLKNSLDKLHSRSSLSPENEDVSNSCHQQK